MLTPFRRFEILDGIYWCIAAALVALLTHPLAVNFERSTFNVRLLMSLGYLGIAMCLTFVYCLKNQSTNWGKVAIGGLLMLLTASVVYSFVRQELVLLVYPSLFCLPGAVFGAALASVRFQSRRSSPQVETQL